MRRTTYINIIRRALLTLCLMVTATMAWADNVAKIGSTEYATLQAAITAASNGQTVTLLMDISTGTESYEIAKQITIDLGGKTITASHTTYNDKLFAITSSGKLTITGEGTITDNDVRGIFYNEGELTIENGTFTTTNNDGYAVIYNTGSTAFFTVKGGTFTGAYAAVYDVEGAKMTIEDGSLSADYGVITRSAASLVVKGGSIEASKTAIQLQNENTKATISGGTVSGKDGVVVLEKSSLIVDGGTITGTNIAISGNGSEGKGETSITINGGTITNEVDIAIYHPQSGSLTINGGTITGVSGIEMKGGGLTVGKDAVITATYTGTPTHNPYSNGNSTVGYAIAIVENGEYAGVSTVNINPEAEINGPVAVLKDSENSTTAGASFDGLQMAVKVTDNTDKVVGQFLSVELAVENAPVGATVTLLDDNTLTSTIETTKNYTLDLNGNKLTSDGQRALWIKSGNVTFKSDPAGIISVPATASSTVSAIRVGSDETTAASLMINQYVTITAEESVAISVEGQNAETSSLTVNGKVTGTSGIEIKGGSLTVGSTADVAATGIPSHVANDTGTSSCGYSIAIVENNVNGKKVTNVNIYNAATLTGPVAELQDSEVTGFGPSYTGTAVAIKVASIEKDKYFTLKDAYNIVPTSGTVKLLGDLTLSETLAMDIEKTCTLDLNGKTLTGNNCAAIQISHGHVTLDGAENSKVTVSGAPTAAIQLGKTDNGENRNVSLTINNNVEVISSVSTGVLLSGTKTRETLEVKGTITTSGEDHIAIKAEDEIAKIRVAKTTGTVTANNAIAIYQANTGELVIEGTVTGTDAVKMYGGNLTVNKDATIKATPATKYAIALVEKANCAGVGRVNISNQATIQGVIACLVESQNNSVADPLFTGDILMVAETDNASGYGEKYAKLEDAIAAASASTADKESVVKLLDDITVTTAVPVNKAITLDMDDYSIIGKQASGATLTVGANVILKNGGITSTKDGISISSGIVTLQNMNVYTQGISLSVSGGTVTADQKSSFSSSGSNTVALNGGKLTMNGKVLNTSSTTTDHAITAEAGDLTIEATATVSSAKSKAINWNSTGNLTIEGGKVMGAEAVHASAGSVTINGGTFTGTGNAVNIAGHTIQPSVTGGTFICGADDVANGVDYEPITAGNAQHFVSGGYFSQHIAPSLCAVGHMISPDPLNNGLFYLVDKLVINDGTIWTVTTEPEKVETYIINATYTRNSGMGANGTHFGTLCLPFSIDPNATSGIPSGMKFYAVASINSEKSEITITELGTTIAEGTPVIFHFDTTDPVTSFTIESEKATVSTAAAQPANNLVGTYKKEDITTGLSDIYYLNSDAFHQANTSLSVPAFRAYIKITSQSSAPERPDVLNIFIEGETTVICLPEQEAAEEVIFDLNGNRQDGLQPGMNIVKMKDGRTIKVYVNK